MLTVTRTILCHILHIFFEKLRFFSEIIFRSVRALIHTGYTSFLDFSTFRGKHGLLAVLLVKQYDSMQISDQGQTAKDKQLQATSAKSKNNLVMHYVCYPEYIFQSLIILRLYL